MAIPMNDSELMQRVQDGQLEFFDELVQRYRIPLTRVAISKLRDASQAEDIVQETFLAVYAARQTYKPEFAFRTWVWTILLNLCRKNWRKQNRKPQEFSQSLFESTSLGSFPEPVSLETGLSCVLQLERDELLFELLDDLPEVQADAIRLRFFGELKYSEIARTMQSSLITAKVRVKKGLLTLARWIQKKSGETP